MSVIPGAEAKNSRLWSDCGGIKLVEDNFLVDVSLSLGT